MPSTDKNTTTTNGSPVSTKTDSAPADAAVAKTVNLLEQIDPKRDAVSRKWAMENGVLLSGGGKHSRLMITNDAPQKYELRLTMDAVDSILWHFDVDPSTETMAVLRKLSGSVRFSANGKAVADAAFLFAKSTYKAGQFETALEFLKMASSTATKFRQRPFAKEILDFRRNIIALKQRDDDAAKASEILADNPDDPKANLEWGSYLCFIKQDWTAGLPLLAKSDNAGLKTVVELEIAASTGAEEMTAVADAWWKLAQSKKANRIQKTQWLTRAGHWYGKAVGELTGLQKTLVEKRINEIAATTAGPRGK